VNLKNISRLSLAKVFPVFFDADRRARLALASLCFLSALEGAVLSISLVKNFGSQARSTAGFTSRQMALLVVCTIVMAGLVWVGVTVLRQPQTVQEWLAWLSKPGFLGGAAHALSFLILALWVIVFGWKGTLELVMPQYNILYDRYYPLFLWALLVSAQAGLFLWLARQPRPEILAEIKALFPRPARSSPLLEIAAILFALSLYGLFLRIQIPGPVSLIFRYDLALLSFPVLFLLYFGFRHSGWVANLIGLSVVLVLASFALACLWNSGISEEPVVMGLLPYKDASNYYTEAQLLLNGSPIRSWGGRPIFSLFLAVLLRLTGSNLQVAIAIMVAITILCCYAAAREVNRNFGAAPAAFTMYLLFVYYRQFIGVTYTENLGLAFGALSLAFLLQGARTSNFWTTVFGLFLASLAMNVRPGPLLILPFLVVWFVIKFRRSNSFKAWVLPSLISCGAILLPFALNLLIIKSMVVPGTAMFSRFPPTFYGLAMGGKSWNQVYLDHPSVNGLPQDQQSAAIFSFTFQQIRAKPGLFLTGIGKFFTDFFTVQYGAFNFIRDALEIRAALFLLSLFGLGYLLKKYRHPGSFLLLACLAGILLSTPFVPSRDSDRMRTYAAAAPFLVVIPSISLGWLDFRYKVLTDEKQPHPTLFPSPGFILSGLLVVCVIVGPFIVKSLAQKPASLKLDCPSNETAFNIRINKGSYVQIIADNAALVSHLPDLRMSDLIHSVNDFSYRGAFVQEPYQPGMLILNTLDLKSEQQTWIAVPSAGLSVDGSVVEVCGFQEKGSIFFFANGNAPAGK